MNERLAAVRKAAGLTQKDFGSRLGGLSQNYIWMIEKGERIPSNRTIMDICREFSVSEEWLRTGRGEMFIQKTESEELSEFFGDLLKDEPDFRHRLISALSRLTLDEWKVLEKLAVEAVEGIKKGGSD